MDLYRIYRASRNVHSAKEEILGHVRANSAPHALRLFGANEADGVQARELAGVDEDGWFIFAAGPHQSAPALGTKTRLGQIVGVGTYTPAGAGHRGGWWVRTDVTTP